jgi:WD40 repeat protein
MRVACTMREYVDTRVSARDATFGSFIDACGAGQVCLHPRRLVYASFRADARARARTRTHASTLSLTSSLSLPLSHFIHTHTHTHTHTLQRKVGLEQGERHAHAVHTLAFSPDGSALVLGSADGILSVLHIP